MISKFARAVLCGAAFFVCGAAAGWEVVAKPAVTTLTGLDTDAYPQAYCIGYLNLYAGGD